MTDEHYDFETSAEPEFGGEVCDFCGRALQWREGREFFTYKTVPHKIGSQPGARLAAQVPAGSPGAHVLVPGTEETFVTTFRDIDGWWAACPPCHERIEADDLEGLVARSVEHHVELMIPPGAPTVLLDRVRKELVTQITPIHAQFFLAKQGDARKNFHPRSNDA